MKASWTILLVQSGAEQLKDWMGRRSYKQSEAAKALGLKESFLSMLVNSKRAPGRELATHIELLTGIPVRAWSSSGDDKEPEPVAASNAKRRNYKK